jgi:hypothetical protein
MPQFTAQNAREMAARSQDSRRRNAAERDNALKLATSDAATISQPVSQTEVSSPVLDAFSLHHLSHAREQLDRLWKLFGECEVPAELDKLASAISKISETARIAADIPLPGSKKPATQKAAYGKKCNSF